MFTDSAFPRAAGLQEYAYSEPFQWVDYRGRPRGALDPSTHFRHNDHANVAWCDGHVTTESWSKLGGQNRYNGDSGKWRIGWFGPQDENGWWNPQRPCREAASHLKLGVRSVYGFRPRITTA
jgi:prepilin-type processing-associated H-X9-DG protein